MSQARLDDITFAIAGLDADGAPVAAMPWDRPPVVEIDGERLRWRYIRFADDQDPKTPAVFGPLVITGRPMPTDVRLGLLREFIALAEPDPTAITSFASQWGVLHLCRYHLPRTHPQSSRLHPGDERRDGPFCQTVVAEDLAGSEAWADWVAWALRARSVVRLASAYAGARNRVNLAREWANLLPPMQAAKAAADSSIGRVRLAQDVERWLLLGDVRPRVSLQMDPHLRVGGLELFGSIALQLAMAVTATAGLAFCSGCADAYIPERQPGAGRRNYCPFCRKSGLPERDASKAWRSRRRGAAT
jgi:hypothetical protein